MSYQILKKSPLVTDYIDMDKLEKKLKMYLDNDYKETADTIQLVIKTMQAAKFLQRMF